MNRKAHILVHGVIAGVLEKLTEHHYRFIYRSDYNGPPVSLAMPITQSIYEFNQFPPFFDGLLPEGILLEALLRKYKIDKQDYFEQLIKVGHDLVGAVNVEEIK